MTREERHLWYDFLKPLPVTFNRQKVIGNCIVDFYCAGARLVIELDGSQHYTDSGKETDEKRDAYLNGLGLTVLRYSNLEINRNFEGVCADILRHIPPHPLHFVQHLPLKGKAESASEKQSLAKPPYGFVERGRAEKRLRSAAGGFPLKGKAESASL